jgi:guanylate kinase
MGANKAVIISAPSGSGKTTIVRYLLENIPDLRFSISATSRNPRAHERHGRDYFFLTRQDFLDKIEGEEFIEWEEVYSGDFYGTLKSEVERIWAENRSVIFDVDVKGGLNLKKYFEEKGLAVFLMVNDMAELEKRLRGRMTESEESIRRRLNRVKEEMKFSDQFDQIVFNDNLDKACSEIAELVRTFLNS